MTAAQESAETLAIQCVAWMAGQDDMLDHFSNATGVGQTDIRERVQDPEFLASVLDFMMMEDAWVMDFCAAHNLPNEAVMQARQVLPGGAQINWT
ncbi:MAG: DUF3572 domain-containing protein [Pseudomonadota bacterium]